MAQPPAPLAPPAPQAVVQARKGCRGCGFGCGGCLSLGGVSISSIPSGYTVDRVYSCAAPDGDTLMIVDGHRLV